MNVSRIVLATSVAAALVATPERGRAQTPATPATITIQNTLKTPRMDETVELSWADVRTRVPAATPARVRVLDAGSRREIVSQVVDNDGDGTPDALLFQTSLLAGESRQFVLDAAASSATYIPARVYATHTMPRDDIAWESDRIAFRTYGRGLWKVDSLLSSGMDVWVKRTRAPIVDRWYAKGHDSYHIDTGEGADFFDVGETLGAGGTAVWSDGTLQRAWNFAGWKIIANGPIRAIFELEYAPWDANGRRVRETKRVAIDAGANLNRVTSIFRADDGAPIDVAVGVVKRPGMIGSERIAGAYAWLTGWGPVSPKMGGHGDLGTAVIVPSAALRDWKELSNHYVAIVQVRSGAPFTYWFGAGWTDSGDFKDVESWWSYLDGVSRRLETPLAPVPARVGEAEEAEWTERARGPHADDPASPAAEATPPAPPAIPHPPSPVPDLVVDGGYTGTPGALVSGVPTYRSLGAALAGMPPNGGGRVVILLRAGRYREKLTIDRPRITLRGEGVDNTVLTYDAAAETPAPEGGTYGTRGSYTLRIVAPDFRAEHLTIENAWDYAANAAKAADDPSKFTRGTQGVALMLDTDSDRAAFEDVHLLGNQDTLFANAGRSWFHRCVIAGSVDFIFGAGRAVFDDCDIVSRDRGSRTNNGYITAASTDVSDAHGFLFVRSRLRKGSPSMAPGSVTLGRPWHPYGDPRAVANVVFIDCWMDDHIGVRGWDRMSSLDSTGARVWHEPASARFAEYGSRGPGAVPSPSRRTLTRAEAARHTPRAVLADWMPTP